ncbi:MAG TPA: glucans biosynthesis glucosyltransferase MdoH [Gammaproteobacteria bacterium]|nr:glucans biosynthesis glucosyltransferase MdoH [Gammaproteobacteria bacterium]
MAAATRKYRAANPRWRRAAFIRHVLLFALVAVQTAFAGMYMLQILPYHGSTGLEAAVLATFIGLFAWISVGFWTAFSGFFTLLFNWRRLAITRICEARGSDSAPLAPTAILMPVYNEDPRRVFAGLKTTYLSLQKTGQLEHFEFFVLSDTTDAESAVREELEWAELCRELNAFSRVHYRRRRTHIKRKSGNIGDFCRRWGSKFRYMIVFDADSVMAGSTLVKMVQMMEVRPEAGIIQTPPVTANKNSLFARIQQFANRVYGPMFTAGVHFWQLGECYYWGHNAIIRIKPFIEHCGLSRLPGSGPLGGEILSHDFVEAALMRRAGWEVWVAYDLPGSYEETPPTLLDELKRDRRWCQGNLQHLRLLGTKGLSSAHRAMFVNGVMAYASALVWLLFLILSTAEVAVQALTPVKYFSNKPSLFPIWPEWHPNWALALVVSTAGLLFLPKILSWLLTLIKQPPTRCFGGFFALTLSVIFETIVASLLAPIRMLFHAKFVLTTLIGRQVKWGAQVREDAETTWGTAIRYHGSATVIAIIWAGGVYWLNPAFFWWLAPIVSALVLSIPLSTYLSRVRLGRLARRLRLFVIPEEIEPPPELDVLNRQLAPVAADVDDFVRAVVDPQVNAIHLAMLRRKPGMPPEKAKRLGRIRTKALQFGPTALTNLDKSDLLQDVDSMQVLHLGVWQITDGELSRQWGLA